MQYSGLHLENLLLFILRALKLNNRFIYVEAGKSQE